MQQKLRNFRPHSNSFAQDGCKEFYNECDNLRERFKDDKDKLEFLDNVNDFVISIEKKYQDA